MHNHLLAGVLLASATLPSAAQEAPDKAAILALTQKAFDAVASQKADDWRAIQHPEGVNYSFRPDGSFRIRNNEEGLSDTMTDDTYSENWIGEPTVLQRGPLAVVWGEYEFYLNGQRNHCGVDVINVGRIEGTWTIIDFGWTVEPDGCPDASR